MVERYSPLLWSICLHYQLNREDIDDVGKNVWLLLVENIGHLREAAALPGWLATTTKHEALRVLRAARRRDHAGLPPEHRLPLDPDDTSVEEELIVAERNAPLRAAFAVLPARSPDLLSLLPTAPPPASAPLSGKLPTP